MMKVRKSRIAGLGAYATRRIPPGLLLGEYEGDLITDDEANNRYGDAESTYLFDVGGGRCIDATHADCVLKFINHSCEPNCEEMLGANRVYYFALREISPGEELTIDYALIADEDVPCRCGSSACRGTMNPRD